MGRRAMPSAQRGDYLKWLRYYLDFCEKYRHPPRDHDSLQPFLQKLAAKGQSPDRQKQAAGSVGFSPSMTARAGRTDPCLFPEF